MQRRIEAAQASRGWLVLEDAGQLAGYAYATPHRPRAAYRYTAEVSAYVAATHRRRGVARRLYTALFELLRLQNVHTALAGITLPNDASQGLHASMGFEAFARYEDVGYKFERWHTTEWWRLVLGDQRQPEELRPLDEVLASEAWDAVLAADRDA